MTLFTLLSLTYPNLTFSYVPLLCTTLHSCIATSLSHSLHNTHIIHSSHTEPKCSLNRLLLDHIFNNEAMSLSSPPPQSSFLARKTHPVFTISLSVILVFSHLLLHCSDHSFSSRLVSSRIVFIELHHCYTLWYSRRPPQYHFTARNQIFCQIFPFIHLE